MEPSRSTGYLLFPKKYQLIGWRSSRTAWAVLFQVYMYPPDKINSNLPTALDNVRNIANNT